MVGDGCETPPADVELARRVICYALAGEVDLALRCGLTASQWDAVRMVARLEGVAPLLCCALERSGWPEQVPRSVRDRLTVARYATAARNQLLYRELTHAVRVFSEPPAIPAVLLKGAALALTLYPDPALRPMSDLDVLVRADRIDQAVARLEADGYREHRRAMAPDLDQLVGHHVHLRSGRAFPIALEVHWTLASSEGAVHAPEMVWFWEQAEPFQRPGAPASASSSSPSPSAAALTLAPTAHLLYLAAHLALYHGAARAQLLWFYDIHLLVEREAERIDWEELIQRARQFRWSAALGAALEGTRRRFGTGLPPGVAAELRGHGDGQIAWLVRRRAARLQTRATNLFSRVASLGWPGRLRLIRSVVLPSPAYVRWRYEPQPSWLWPLCYPYRWLDIVQEGISTLWRAIRQ